MRRCGSCRRRICAWVVPDLSVAAVRVLPAADLCWGGSVSSPDCRQRFGSGRFCFGPDLVSLVQRVWSRAQLPESSFPCADGCCVGGYGCPWGLGPGSWALCFGEVFLHLLLCSPPQRGCGVPPLYGILFLSCCCWVLFRAWFFVCLVL